MLFLGSVSSKPNTPSHPILVDCKPTMHSPRTKPVGPDYSVKELFRTPKFYVLYLIILILSLVGVHRQTDRQTDRQADRLTGRQTGWQTERQTDRQTGRQIARLVAS